MGTSEFNPTPAECVQVRRLARQAERMLRERYAADFPRHAAHFQAIGEQAAHEATVLAVRVRVRGIMGAAA